MTIYDDQGNSKTYSVEVHAQAVGYVDVNAASEADAIKLVDGMEISHVRELMDFETVAAELA